MPPIAICSSPECSYQVMLQNPVEGTAIPTPQECPDCGASVISLCPNCGFLLLGDSKSAMVTCSVCGRDIKEQLAFRLNLRGTSF